MNRQEDFRLAARWLLKSLAGNVFLGAILFLSAGTFQWLMGWVFLAITALVSISTFVLIDDSVIVERSVNHFSSERWDNIILSLFGIMSLIFTPLVAGLTVRFDWPPHIGPVMIATGLLVTVAGWAFHIWAMQVNRYFAIVVRLQDDRNQTVVRVGPYRWMRHPGYVGGILVSIAMPLMLGSFWALIPGIMAALLLVIRTYLEDRFLQRSLDGYSDYTEQVRYRLIPGLW